MMIWAICPGHVARNIWGMLPTVYGHVARNIWGMLPTVYESRYVKKLRFWKEATESFKKRCFFFLN